MQYQLRNPNEPDSVIIHSHLLIASSEYSFIHFANNRGIYAPTEKAVSKACMLCSKEPEFPTSMFFGLCLGLAFWGGCEHFIGVRQSRTLLAVWGTKSLHQWLQFVLLQLEVQLDTVTQVQEVFFSSCINLKVFKVFLVAVTFMTDSVFDHQCPDGCWE